MLLLDKIFSDAEVKEFTEWHTELGKKKSAKNDKSQITEKEIWLLSNPCPITDKIKEYYDKGYGLKVIARNLNTSYTKVRQLFPKIKIDIRRGQDVCTPITKQFRKKKAIFESKNEIGFNNPSIRRKSLKTGRGVQGFYFNKSLGKYVWLRSTYEYIFAKWLDRTNHKWDVEVQSFRLPNNELYRPDFFILGDNCNILSIIEIKGYWDNRAYKVNILDSILDIDVVIISDVTEFLPKDSTYIKELKHWKTERKINGKN